MKIIISPAKKMIDTSDEFTPSTSPLFLSEAKELHHYMKSCSKSELKKILKCNDQLVSLNHERFHTNKIDEANMMALVTYQGLQYQTMAPHIFTDEEWNYVNENLIILSGLYGMLRPTDSVVQYRLEMQAKINHKKHKTLYEFWGTKIASQLDSEKDFILNLASKEYGDVVEKHLQTKMITCIFGEFKDNKVIVKGTLAKMARGAMVRYLATNNIRTTKGIKQFSENGFKYSEKLSSEYEFVFIKDKN